MSKYIVKTTLLAAHNIDDKISSGVYRNYIAAGCSKNWFEKMEPEVKNGQYWQYEGGFPMQKGVLRISEVYDTTFCYRYIDDSQAGSASINRLIDNATLLSPDEIEQALIEEGERREFQPHQKVRRSWDFVQKELRLKGTVANGKYFPGDDTLLMSEFGTIYCKGNWAEIIGDEWEVVFNPDNPNNCAVENDKRIIRNVTQKEAEAIATALNELD